MVEAESTKPGAQGHMFRAEHQSSCSSSSITEAKAGARQAQERRLSSPQQGVHSRASSMAPSMAWVGAVQGTGKWDKLGCYASVLTVCGSRGIPRTQRPKTEVGKQPPNPKPTLLFSVGGFCYSLLSTNTLVFLLFLFK